MLKTEFESLMGMFVPDALYDIIEKKYLEYDGDKHAFCKAIKDNADGLAEKILLEFAVEQEKKRVSVENQIDDLQKTVILLKNALEREQEWKPYESNNAVSQSNYEKFQKSEYGGTKSLSDDEAKDILYKRFGFAKEMVKILHTLPSYEINRHRQLRKVGEVVRDPLYVSTDLYYIGFECAGFTYEILNDDLTQCW